MAIKHTFVSAKSDGADTSLVRPSNWNADHTIENDSVSYAQIQNVSATDKILGRLSAGAGDIEEITCTAAGRALLDDADASAQRTTLGLGTLATQSGTFSGTSSGTNTGDQTITLTGDVTGSGTGSFATTIGASKVTNTMLAGSIALTKLSSDTTTALGLGTVELGHASDTTLSRSSAGVLAVEGVVVPTVSSTNTLTNKSLSDSTTSFVDDLDGTKKMQFQLSGITTATTRTLTVPNVDGTIVTTGDSGSVTNTMLAGSIALTKLTGDTTTALGVGTVELGHASDTTLSRVSAGRLAVEGVNVVTTSSTDTLSNKTISGASNTLTVRLANDVSGTLPVGSGGTGATSFTSGSIPFSNGTNLTQDNANLFFDDTNNRLGVGTSSPSTTVHAIATTEQLRVGYDTTNYYKTTVGSTGTVTLDAVGSGAKFTFSDAVEVPDDAYASGWNGSTQVPTKNAIYDRLEVMKTESFVIACSDETTALTAGTAKVKFRMPYAFTVTAVRASLSTAQASGNIFTVDINEAGTSILSTKLTIDNTETSSQTAATAPVISDSSIADDAEISVDIDQIGNGSAKGLKVVLIGYKS